MRNPKKVFICYSHADAKWLKWLDPVLKPLIRDGAVEEWSDRKIAAGSKWEEEIASALDSCGIGILLISQDFLASDFIFKNELPPILNAARNDGLKLICIYVRPCDVESSPQLAEYQAVNSPDKPLAELSTPARDRVGISIAKALREYQAWTGISSEVKLAEEVESAQTDDEEKGYLEYKADSSAAQSAMIEVVTRIGELTVNIGERFTSKTEAINKLLTRGEDNPQLAVSIVNAGAMDLNEYSRQMEASVEEFREKAKAVHDNIVPWLRWRKDQGHVEDNEGLATTLRGTVESVETSITHMESFRNSISGMRGASRTMNAAVSRAQRVLTSLIETMRQVSDDSKEYLTLVM